MLLVAAIERGEAETFWEPRSKLKQGSVGSRDWCELARSPTEPSSGMQNAQHQATLISANQSVRQRALCAHEYITTAPFVFDPGDYGRILFGRPRASVG
jgi:hypothetical protein